MPMYFPDDGASAVLLGPELTYTTGVLTRIDYDGGEFKTFSYTNGALTTVTLDINGTVTTKTLNYNNGTLTSITET